MAFTLDIGEKAPDFDLKGVDNIRYSLASFAGDKVLVVAFTCNHCPYVIGTEERMIDFCDEYGPRGMSFIAINSNETENHPTDDFEHMEQRAEERGFNFPYVRDETQEVARAYGALRTPHFFVFDEHRKLRYTGRMDDNPKNEMKATTHELADAVEALLEDEEVPVKKTNPIGCNIKWQGKPAHWMPPEACDLVLDEE